MTVAQRAERLQRQRRGVSRTYLSLGATFIVGTEYFSTRPAPHPALRRPGSLFRCCARGPAHGPLPRGGGRCRAGPSGAKRRSGPAAPLLRGLSTGSVSPCGSQHSSIPCPVQQYSARGVRGLESESEKSTLLA